MNNKSIDVNQLINRITNLKTVPKKAPDHKDTQGPLPVLDSRMDVKDFLVYNGDEFVDCAYNIILGRDPDSEGRRHYVSQMASGKLTKHDVLSQLRFSPEGQMRGITIKGLTPTREQKEIANQTVNSSLDPQKDFYQIEDFLKYDGKEFILRAYQGILKRIPDEQGIATHLGSLQNGAKSKEDILRELRYSEEGEAREVRIVDLLPKIRELEPAQRQKKPLVEVAGGECHIEDLLVLPDQSFVARVFFLSRGVYPEEADMAPYLQALREGKKTRAEVAAELKKTAPEAFSQTRIRGLGLYRFRQRIKKIPLAGEAANFLLKMLIFPGWAARLQARISRAQAAEGWQWDNLDRENRQIRAKLKDVVDWHWTVNERLSSLQGLADLEPMVREQKEQIFLIKRLIANKADTADVERELQHLEKKIGQEAARIESLAEVVYPERMLKKDLGPLYSDLYDRFRGAYDDVKKRLAPNLKEVMDTGLFNGRGEWILDIGCGRGEWLEILEQHGIRARGIDMMPHHVEACIENGLEAAEAEALAHLKDQADNSIMGISALHLIEHLPFPKLAELLREIFRVLKPGGLFLLETPNPENINVSSHTFYLDPTHQKPLPSMLIRKLVQSTGFLCNDVQYLNPGADSPDASEESSLEKRAFDYLLTGTKP